MIFVMITMGTALGILWMILFAKSGMRYQDEMNKLDSSEYFMKDLFGTGFYVIDLLGFKFDTPYFENKLIRLNEIYGAKNGRKILKADLVAQISYSIFLVPVGILLYGITDEPMCLIFALIILLFLVLYIEYDKQNRVEKRRSEIIRSFPHVLSQMALLINAGMPLREALQMASAGKTDVLGNEMKILLDDMKNGIPEYEALRRFSDRCGVDSIRKFASLVIQNVRKGSNELAGALLEMSNEIWRARVGEVKEEGEKASAKLMIPILIIFMGIIMMVVVPIFSGMNI